MQKTLAAAAIAAVLGTAGAANAADFYSPGFKDGPVTSFPLWSGWYAGAHIGGAWGSLDVTDDQTNVKFSNDTSGVFGGGQFGYLYQLGRLVIGPEVDLGGMSLSHSGAEPGVAVDKIGSGFYMDFTGRAGLAFGPSLVYIKGGYTYYDGNMSLSDATGTSSTPARGGYTVGAGVEYLFTPAWSVKAEYQYFDYSMKASQFTTPGGNVYDFDPTVQTFKVGFNYHLGGVYAPLK